MRIVYHVLSAPSPLGLLFAARTERGLRLLEFMDRRSLKRTIAAHAEDLPGAQWEPSVRDLRGLGEQLEQYFCGTLRAFDVPLDLAGGELALRVWRALLAIPFGQTRTYGEIAAAIGDPRAVRAVAQAIGQNPLPIVVPCHRVIGADGKLVGYRGGLPRKKFLLATEARFRGMPDLESNRVIDSLTVRVARPPAEPRRVRTGAKKKRAARPVNGSDRSRRPAARTSRRPAAAAAPRRPSR